MGKRRARGDTEGSRSPTTSRSLWERGCDHSEACKACDASELLFGVEGRWQQSAWREQGSRTMACVYHELQHLRSDSRERTQPELFFQWSPLVLV